VLRYGGIADEGDGSGLCGAGTVERNEVQRQCQSVCPEPDVGAFFSSFLSFAVNGAVGNTPGVMTSWLAGMASLLPKGCQEECRDVVVPRTVIEYYDVIEQVPRVVKRWEEGPSYATCQELAQGEMEVVDEAYEEVVRRQRVELTVEAVNVTVPDPLPYNQFLAECTAMKNGEIRAKFAGEMA
jgi:hypothetical protein